ncbi:uncharacterized protein LOC143032612 [Oratosquilla oratoria]|uniref:uncharacterized protein LOC143032612 n=1 Tax=Oratosquilla oratoria TaxID=337810 RepID=UPI003F75EF0D
MTVGGPQDRSRECGAMVSTGLEVVVGRGGKGGKGSGGGASMRYGHRSLNIYGSYETTWEDIVLAMQLSAMCFGALFALCIVACCAYKICGPAEDEEIRPKILRREPIPSRTPPELLKEIYTVPTPTALSPAADDDLKSTPGGILGSTQLSNSTNFLNKTNLDSLSLKSEDFSIKTSHHNSLSSANLTITQKSNTLNTKIMRSNVNPHYNTIGGSGTLPSSITSRLIKKYDLETARKDSGAGSAFTRSSLNKLGLSHAEGNKFLDKSKASGRLVDCSRLAESGRMVDSCRMMDSGRLLDLPKLHSPPTTSASGGNSGGGMNYGLRSAFV